jgi:CheY-like chemotaxis protein
VTSGSPVVLVVDDDHATLKTLGHLLRHFGFEVLTEKDPHAAIELIDRRDDIVVLVCDFEMPGMNGELLARAVKGRRAHLPVFVFSGTNPPDVNPAPWDAWFLKGIAVSELIEKLQPFRGQSRE